MYYLTEGAVRKKGKSTAQLADKPLMLSSLAKEHLLDDALAKTPQLADADTKLGSPKLSGLDTRCCNDFSSTLCI